MYYPFIYFFFNKCFFFCIPDKIVGNKITLWTLNLKFRIKIYVCAGNRLPQTLFLYSIYMHRKFKMIIQFKMVSSLYSEKFGLNSVQKGASLTNFKFSVCCLKILMKCIAFLKLYKIILNEHSTMSNLITSMYELFLLCCRQVGNGIHTIFYQLHVFRMVKIYVNFIILTLLLKCTQKMFPSQAVVYQKSFVCPCRPVEHLPYLHLLDIQRIFVQNIAYSNL